jgi:hypothetical protein
MPITLAGARTNVRSNLEESSASFWTDAELTAWINDGCRDIARRAQVLINYFTALPVVAGTATYGTSGSLPSDIIQIHRIEYVPTGSTQTYPLDASTVMEMDNVWGTNQAQQSSYPSYWVTLGRPGGSNGSPQEFRIKLFPVPSQSGNLNIYYYSQPPTLINGTDDATNLPVLEGWWDLVVLYCEWNAKRKDRNPEWSQVMALYEQKLQDMIDVSSEFHDQSQFMYSSTGSAVPSWLYAGGDW